ncbi:MULTISPECIES: type II toxin-antitoxin system HipA family toxin [Cupriavidus]|uniref:HipA-like protein n=1 Tax=Cupriavidus pinatubonensis (strain JMP 134 / LMG 1197) TaxID=264198 RepID=Q46N12_CUPPJ|nr:MULTISPECIES: type II toxin-antitoxin system HipA family toxin [Cupriavidus]QYY34058.1 type II toxin-antitoxin system HipA family toxin [Cupriavidus pinatubonensis]
MTGHLYVWLYQPHSHEPVLCGRLDLIGGRQCLFSYAPDYLRRKDAIALSPDLPLRNGQYAAPSGLELHPVFEDAGPDRWGRRVIDRAFNPRRRASIDYLALAGEDRIGALGFASTADSYEVNHPPVFHRGDLPGLIEAARAVELQLPIDDRLRQLLRPGGTAGGARPKAIIDDDGSSWIAKFAAEGDEVDFCAIEHASLVLAQACGIDAPESRLVQLGRQNTLLVKRFDREPGGGGRIHFASARTLLLAEGIPEEQMSYADIAEVARRYSPEPLEDCLQMFRRMVLNILIENTDDHAKNHAFLHHGGENWRLSPVYDVQPQLQGIPYQQLIVGDHGTDPTLANALSQASRFMLTPAEAHAEVEKIVETVSGWREVFFESGVCERDIRELERFIVRDSELPPLPTRRRTERGV